MAEAARRSALAFATPPADRESRRAPDADRNIVLDVIVGVIRNAFAARGDHRTLLLRQLWTELKGFGASNVQRIPLSRIRGIEDARVDGPVAKQDALVITALAAILECDTIFTFGRAARDISAVLTHNLPEAQIYTLVSAEPEPLTRARTHPTQPAGNVTHLTGSAETFDLSSHSGKSDLVLIDPGDATSEIREATDAAFSVLSELGTIVWANYTQAAAYSYLNSLAPALDRPVFHILGTRIALYSRWDIVRPDV